MVNNVIQLHPSIDLHATKQERLKYLQKAKGRKLGFKDIAELVAFALAFTIGFAIVALAF